MVMAMVSAEKQNSPLTVKMYSSCRELDTSESMESVGLLMAALLSQVAGTHA